MNSTPSSPTTVTNGLSPTQVVSGSPNQKAPLKKLQKVEQKLVKEVDIFESDPFCEKSLHLTENVKMAKNNYDKHVSEETKAKQELPQEDLLEDIADNTNPDFVVQVESTQRLADAKLHFKPDDDFFRVRKHLMAQRSHIRSSSTDRFFNSKKAFDPFTKLNQNENMNGDKIDDHHEVWSFSDFDFYEDENEEEDTRLILNILKLEKNDSERKQTRKARRQATSSVRKTFSPNNTRYGQRVPQENAEDSISDNFNPFSNRFAIEYEDCAEGRVNGSCCGADDDHEDNGLDSTLSISIRDDIEMQSLQDTDKKPSRENLKKVRGRVNRVNFEQTASPFKKQSTSSYKRISAPRLRQAFSQVNKDELEREQRMHDESESIEDFEMAAMMDQAEQNQ